jgi:hypothetical protein
MLPLPSHPLRRTGLLLGLGLLGLAALASHTQAQTAPNVSDLKPLNLLWNASRGDYATCGTPDCVARQVSSDPTYVSQGDQGYVFAHQQPGTVKLEWFWDPYRQDNVLCGTTYCMNAQTGWHGPASHPGDAYTDVGTEGWAYSTQQPGTAPLYLFWKYIDTHDGSYRGDNLTCLQSPQCNKDQPPAGYTYVEIEGYAMTAPDLQVAKVAPDTLGDVTFRDLTVYNASAMPILQSFYVNVLSANQVTRLYRVDGLGAWATTHVRVKADCNGTATITLDATHVVPEASETNNVFSSYFLCF